MKNLPQSAHVREERVLVGARIPASLDRAIEVKSAKERKTKQQVIEDALREHLEGDAVA